MKRIEKKEQSKIIGGVNEVHYHWFCNVNNYRGVKRTSRADAEADVKAHRAKYPSHYYNTYVISCTGNC